MFRKILVCLGGSFVLTVVCILFGGGIPKDHGDADETFARVAQELKAMQDESVDRADAFGSDHSQASPAD